MAGGTYTVNFDSGIEKVEYSSSLFDFPEGEITTSGGTLAGVTELYVKPKFKQGYILDTTNVDASSTAGIYLATKDGAVVRNIVFTSKQGGVQL